MKLYQISLVLMLLNLKVMIAMWCNNQQQINPFSKSKLCGKQGITQSWIFENCHPYMWDFQNHKWVPFKNTSSWLFPGKQGRGWQRHLVSPVQRFGLIWVWQGHSVRWKRVALANSNINPGTACTVDVDGCFVMVAGGYLTDNGYQTPTIFTRGCCWAVPRQKVKVWSDYLEIFFGPEHVR